MLRPTCFLPVTTKLKTGLKRTRQRLMDDVLDLKDKSCRVMSSHQMNTKSHHGCCRVLSLVGIACYRRLMQAPCKRLRTLSFTIRCLLCYINTIYLYYILSYLLFSLLSYCQRNESTHKRTQSMNAWLSHLLGPHLKGEELHRS